MPYINIAFSLKWRAVSLLASKILSVAWLCGLVDTTSTSTPHAKGQSVWASRLVPRLVAHADPGRG